MIKKESQVNHREQVQKNWGFLKKRKRVKRENLFASNNASTTFYLKARGIIKQDWFQRFIQKSINYSKYGNIYFERYESKIKYSDYLNAS